MGSEMNRTIRKLSIAFTAGCLGFTPWAYSDLSYTQHIRVEAAGAMSMASSEGDVVTQIAGDKSRAESDIKMASSLAAAFAGGGKTVSIVRLDKQLSWNLLTEKQGYT